MLPLVILREHRRAFAAPIEVQVRRAIHLKGSADFVTGDVCAIDGLRFLPLAIGALEREFEFSVGYGNFGNVVHVAAWRADKSAFQIRRARACDLKPPGTVARFIYRLDVPAPVERVVSGESGKRVKNGRE